MVIFDFLYVYFTIFKLIEIILSVSFVIRGNSRGEGSSGVNMDTGKRSMLTTHLQVHYSHRSLLTWTQGKEVC